MTIQIGMEVLMSQWKMGQKMGLVMLMIELVIGMQKLISGGVLAEIRRVLLMKNAKVMTKIEREAAVGNEKGVKAEIVKEVGVKRGKEAAVGIAKGVKTGIENEVAAGRGRGVEAKKESEVAVGIVKGVEVGKENVVPAEIAS